MSGIIIVLGILMILACIWAVMARSLLRAAIALALASAILSGMMYVLESPLAAVFELSVCSGLITVLFISTISMTRPRTEDESQKNMKERIRQYGLVPVISLLGGIILIFAAVNLYPQITAQQNITDVRLMLWNLRRLDILGQVIILLCGVFGVIILFKGSNKK
jgi:NADH-quinone oxidoreductase subunit J